MSLASFTSTTIPSNFVDVLLLRNEQQPDQPALTFLIDGDQRELSWTYHQLDVEARRIAILLQRQGLAGERALLLYPPGLPFVAALFGCFYAGVIVVPCDLPRPRRSIGRLERIAQDVRPAVILTTAECAQGIRDRLIGQPFLSDIPVEATDALCEVDALEWIPRSCSSEHLALIQYTSGSTSQPKGVLLSHANLLANSQQIARAFGHSPGSRGVSWLPTYHDMGLIGGVLQPLFAGFPVVLMSPIHVVQNPLRWLRAISRYGATTSGGPNFIYDRCVDSIRAEQLSELDLSCWQVAFSGAEPIQARTMRRFAETFSPCGFSSRALFPCYGLAEASLLVSGGPPGSGAVMERFDRRALESERTALPPHNGSLATELVGSGVAGTDIVVRIVNPETERECPPETIGEIWVSGPNVASGYWNHPEQSAETFEATLDDDRHYLRTGDLGFLRNGQVFVAGRIKDLIILDGRNHYSQDVEQTVEHCHSALKGQGGVAFAFEADGAEHLAIVHEVYRNGRGVETEDVIHAICRSVSEEHEITVSHVALVKCGEIPRTSSGKVQRSQCRGMLRMHELDILAEWRAKELGPLPPNQPTPVVDPSVKTETAFPAASVEMSAEAIQEWLVAELRQHLPMLGGPIDLCAPLASFGLTSRESVEISGRLESLLQRRLSPTIVYEYPTIDALSRVLGHARTPHFQCEPSSFARSHAEREESIALVGLSCRFPGAPHPEAFWKLLTEGHDAIREVPANRWDPTTTMYRSLIEGHDPDRTCLRWGGFLDEIEAFDAGFFGIAPREAMFIDPQQRLLLEVAWEALEDAGQTMEAVRGSRTGVFVGISTNDYAQLCLRQVGNLDPYWATGNASCIAANRLSYFLDLKGPSLAIDTACSSSLVATHLACSSLRSGECDMALAGGVNVILTPAVSTSFAQAGGLAPDGRCKAFDARANGIVRSEGVGVVVLKRLSQALADGDPIYAVIRGSAVNQDGRSNGLTAPLQASQEAVLREAYHNAGISPAEVQYIEAHGAGSALGDVMEANALKNVLSPGRAPEDKCVLGSVKTNIGHLEAAAGIAGLIKVALALKHHRLPANLHFHDSNPRISFADMPFIVSTEGQPWPARDGRRWAGVSGFGFGGTNAHVVLESAPAHFADAAQITLPFNRFSLTTNGVKSNGHHHKPTSQCVPLLTLSAASVPALRQLAANWIEWLARAENVDIAPVDLCSAAVWHRSHHRERAAICFRNRDELLQRLTALQNGDHNTHVSTGAVPFGMPSKLAFVFSGQGGQWWNMGRALYQHNTVFRDRLAECDTVLREFADWSLREELLADEDRSHLSGTNVEYLEINQVSQFALQVALADVWKSWGIQPDAVIGHSFGEAAAACVAGALTLSEAIRVVAIRSRLMSAAARTASRDSGMAAVRIAAEDAETWLRGYAGRLFISAYNSPKYTVVSGKLDALEKLIEDLRKQKIGGKVMPVPGAGHTPELEPIRGPLEAALADLRPQAGTVPIYSTVTGGLLSGTEFDASYWGRNLVQTVNFAPAVEKLSREGFGTFVELGPAPLLIAAIHQSLEHHERTGQAFASLRPKEDDNEILSRALGALYVTGRSIEWKNIIPPSRRRVSLPTYPWQHERYWLESVDPPHQTESSPHSGHPVLGDPVELADPPGAYLWQSRIDGQRLKFLDDYRVDGTAILTAGALLEAALAAAQAALDSGPWWLEEVELPGLHELTEAHLRQLQAIFKPTGNESGRFQCHSRGITQKAWRLDVSVRVQRLNTSSTDDEDAERARINAVRNRCSQPVDVQQFYDSLAATGQTIGSSCRVLQEIGRGRREAVGSIRLSDALSYGSGSFVVHPVLIEACLHLASIARRDADVWLSIPVFIESIRVWQHPTPETSLRAHCMTRGEATSEAPLVTDVVVWDEQHHKVLEITGLRVERQRCAEIYAGQQDSHEWLYEVQWRPMPLPSSTAVTTVRAPGTWVLLADTQGITSTLQDALSDHDQCSFVVTPGHAFRQCTPQHFEVNPLQSADFRRLFDEIGQRGLPPVVGVVNLWGSRSSAMPTNTESLEEAEAQLLTGTLHLVQTIDKTDFAEMPRLWLITQRAQQLPSDTRAVSLEQAPLWGLGRTLQREHPNWRCTLVDLSADDASEAHSLCAELLADDVEDQLALRDGTRYAARLARPSADHECYSISAITTPQISTDATYLITGGLGGIGLYLAEWLIAGGARHLVLMSRRTPSPEVEDHLRALREMGAKIVHAPADLTNRAEVQRTFKQIATEMPPLRGVLHCASTLDDAPLAQMLPSQLKSVLASKTYGAWNLHELTQGLPLDFFVLFSSGAALIGPPGSANYAAGNAFLDALAEYRRQRGLTALSIGWGLWGDVGMVTGSDRQNRIKLSGFRTMPAATAVRMMGQLLTTNISRLAVMPVDWAQLRRAARTTTRTPFLSDVFAEVPDIAPEEQGSTDIAAILRAMDSSERPGKLLDYLKNRLSVTLGTAPEKIPHDRSLAALGVDSLLALELKNRVESELQITIRIVELLEGPTLQNLAASILKQWDRPLELNGHQPAVNNGSVRTIVPRVDDGKAAKAVLDRIDELPDDEVEALYQQMMAEEEGRA